MLKSTHRLTEAAAAPEPLPAGWTEHKAPTGHTYYYNAETKKSTYTRPVTESEELLIDYEANAPDQVVQASMKVMEEFHKHNPPTDRGQSHFTGGRSYQNRPRRDKYNDRPKSKKAIKNCEPWILVTTRYRRRFVHNTDTKESLWKFPSEVMLAVIEMEKVEWQAKQNGDNIESDKQEVNKVTPVSHAPDQQPIQPEQHDFDSDSYEEVEVTDDEDEDPLAKRQRIDEMFEDVPKGPVEFDEDDIAWQLAQMEDEDVGFDEMDDADEEDGLPMTSDDSKALFRSLLDDMRINPYSPFDDLLHDNNSSMLEDDRWTILPNMASRRGAFTYWSKDRISELKAREAQAAATLKTKKRDPQAEYLEFLREQATPKLYWPEFKRKFKKESIMKDYELTDKDREKLYREYITKLKTSEGDRKKDFITLLKGIPEGESWHRRTSVNDLPDSLVRDIKFYGIRDKRVRDALVEAHIGTLNEPR